MRHCLRSLSLFPSLVLALAQSFILPAEAECVPTERRLTQLANDPQWRAFLHYGTSTLGSEKSRIDDPRFFLSKEGKINPLKELKATLKAFAQGEGNDVNAHAVCRYPARYRWLDSKISGVIASVLPERCETFHWWKSAIDAQSATLIFPTSYLNNPASAFGHTLLRFDPQGVTENTRPLSYTANYSAQTAGESAIVYAVKGVVGGFQGQFSVSPYYHKIRKYSDLENRDIWEYRLDLSKGEVDRLIEHLWELRGVSYRYFYFDENCSYQLLALLDVARPDLGLSRRYPISVIPTDTVRDIVSLVGIVGERVFRPSAARNIRGRIDTMTGRELLLSEQVFLGELSPEELETNELSEQQQASVLELAYDFLVYHELRKNRAEQSTARKLELLAARSQLPVKSTAVSVQVPEYAPEQGHRSGRIGLGSGVAFDRTFLSYQWRPAYHDLLDPQRGFDSGASISFLNTEFRQYRGESVRLEQFELLKVDSLTPREFFFKPVSWAGEIGLQRRQFSDGTQKLVERFGVQSGVTYGTEEKFSYALLDLTQEAGAHFQSEYALGGGGEVGLYYTPEPGVTIHPVFAGRRFALGDTFTELELGLHLGISLDERFSLRIQSERRWALGPPDNSVRITSFWYFQ